MIFELATADQLAVASGRLPADASINKIVLEKGSRNKVVIHLGYNYRVSGNAENFPQVPDQFFTAFELDPGDIPGYTLTNRDVDRQRVICLRTEYDDRLIAPSPIDGSAGELRGNIRQCCCIPFSPGKKSAAGQVATLIHAMQSLKNDNQTLFAEFMEPDWFKRRGMKSELMEQLHAAGIGLVLTDYLLQPSLLHMGLTIPKTIIRFAANNLDDSDYLRLDEWVLKIKSWMDRGLNEMIFIIHTPDRRFISPLGRYLAEQLRRECGYPLVD